jgi:hypothetical protein
MLFAILNHDKPASLDLRMKTRETHLAYLRAAGDMLKLAGPLLDEAGESPAGSLLIVEADSLADARTFAANDPYAKAGLFASSTVTPWRQVFPEG